MKPYLTATIQGEDYAIPNPEYWKEQHKRKYEILLKKSNIPQNYWDLDFDDYEGELSVASKDKAVQYAQKCQEEKFHNVSLYMHGQWGTQKSMISCAIGKEFIRQGLSVKFVYAGELIDLLLKSQGFEYHKELEKEVDFYTHVDLLIIDDIFDKNKSVYWKKSPELIVASWDTFLRRRISEDRRTILNSNFSLEAIKEEFGESIYELLNRNFVSLTFFDEISKTRKKRFEGLWD